jgi:hypothetical protein
MHGTCNGGPGQRSRHSDSLRAGRSGDRIPVEARFSAPVQTGPGAHPAPYTTGTGSFPRIKRPKRGVDHPPHKEPRLKKEQIYTSTPPLGLRDLFWGEHYLYLYGTCNDLAVIPDCMTSEVGFMIRQPSRRPLIKIRLVSLHPPGGNEEQCGTVWIFGLRIEI